MNFSELLTKSSISISLKEAYETRFWLKIIRDSLPWAKETVLGLLHRDEELIRLLVSIIKTSKANLKKK
ncbi:MAG: four helix bundle protein [Patescibacteria group bacterium]